MISGYAKFGDLGFVELDRVCNKANHLTGGGIPGKYSNVFFIILLFAYIHVIIK